MSERVYEIESARAEQQAPAQGRVDMADRDADGDLPSPYGGALRDLLVPEAVAKELVWESRDWPSWDLTDRQLCDLELLLNGGFSPLAGFMGRADYSMWITFAECVVRTIGMGQRVPLVRRIS